MRRAVGVRKLQAILYLNLRLLPSLILKIHSVHEAPLLWQLSRAGTTSHEPVAAPKRTHTSSSLFPELLERDLLVIVLVQDLGCCQLEVLLRHVNSAFSQRVHTRLGAHTLELSA